jgi:hypothetical protein
MVCGWGRLGEWLFLLIPGGGYENRRNYFGIVAADALGVGEGEDG